MSSLPNHRRRSAPWALWAVLALPALAGCQCISSGCDAVPATRVPPQFLAERRSARGPIDYTLLRQLPPKEYRVGPRDLLGVYIQGVLPGTSEQPPVIYSSVQTTQEYFPATGQLNSPVVGVPITVQAAGVLPLPLVDPVPVNGLTLTEAAEAIRKEYVQKRKILQPGRDRILVTLIKPRVHRVLVVRDDAKVPFPTLRERHQQIIAKQGSSDVVDLPAYENDVLHALLATGGLPGQDARSDIWVLHSEMVDVADLEAANLQITEGADPRHVIDAVQTRRKYTRVPLRMCPGEPIPFAPDDVILHDGDIVFIETRETEFFFTGGLLPAGQIPLPRDYDLDIVEAIAYANGSVGGPAGENSVSANYRNNLGSIFPATRVIILRKLACGDQVKIRVDLSRAMNDPRERIIVQPGDMVMLHYKPGEFAGNVLLNFANLNITFVPTGALQSKK